MKHILEGLRYDIDFAALALAQLVDPEERKRACILNGLPVLYNASDISCSKFIYNWKFGSST